jgi:NDP-sugar pyrophosphorylase family protein
MKAMILSKGEGKELNPLTDRDFPKAVVPIANISSIQRNVQLLSYYGVKEIIVNLDPSEEKIKEVLGDGDRWGVSIFYSYEEDLLGTAGGVRKVDWFFQMDSFLVLSADVVTNINLREMIKFHHQKNSKITIGIQNVEHPSNYGIVRVDDEGRIVKYQEKPKIYEAESNLANTGIYILDPIIFNYIPENVFYDFGKNLFGEIIDKEDIYGFLVEDYWNDIGEISTYKKVNFDILLNKVDLEIPGRNIKPGLWIGEEVEISESAYIHPPVIIGDKVNIGDKVQIYGPTIIGDEVKIGGEVIIEESIIWSKVIVKPSSKIISCIIGNNCVLGDRSIIYRDAVIGNKVKIRKESFVGEDRRIKVN